MPCRQAQPKCCGSRASRGTHARQVAHMAFRLLGTVGGVAAEGERCSEGGSEQGADDLGGVNKAALTWAFRPSTSSQRGISTGRIFRWSRSTCLAKSSVGASLGTPRCRIRSRRLVAVRVVAGPGARSPLVLMGKPRPGSRLPWSYQRPPGLRWLPPRGQQLAAVALLLQALPWRAATVRWATEAYFSTGVTEPGRHVAPPGKGEALYLSNQRSRTQWSWSF